MLGLIATMTPMLYKHVSERRQDIENINEANTLLLLKNAAAEYIEANKETLGIGTTVLSPADIGVDISGYQIGIRKDSSGKIDAMIASAAGGNDDMKAAKVAALLGISAGIYSAQNLTKAWGINGVWAEDISNYGFASLPTGIPVITTAYDKEDASGLNEEQLKDFIENTAFDKFTVKEICLNDDCQKAWPFFSPEVECIKNLHCANRTDGKNICDTTVNKCFVMPEECTSLINKKVISVTAKTADFGLSWSGTECLSPIKELFSYHVICPGNYKIELTGEAGKILNSYTENRSAAGGILKAEKIFTVNTVLTVKSVSGGYTSQYMGGAGISLWENGNMLLVAGGGSGKLCGGGGKVGGKAISPVEPQSIRYGYGFNGNKGEFAVFPSANTNSAQGGGGLNTHNWDYSYGGSGTEIQECSGNGFNNCALIPGGSQSGYIANSYSSVSYGNRGAASATVVYLGL